MSFITISFRNRINLQLCYCWPFIDKHKNPSVLSRVFIHSTTFISKSSYSNLRFKSSILSHSKSNHKLYRNTFKPNFTDEIKRTKDVISSTSCDKNSESVIVSRKSNFNQNRKKFITEGNNPMTAKNQKSSDELFWTWTPNHPLLGGTMTQPITVCVEGNIGSGKTTFLKHFKTNSEISVFDEPISKWRDCQGYNLLDLMYKDPRKWSLCFQSYVQLTMLDLHTKSVEQPIKMLERSMFSAHYCFVENLKAEGLMDDAQYAVLSEWFDFANKNLPIKVDLIVYLRTDPEVAFKRIAQRGRSEENSIKLEYLQSVHKLHEDWLIHKKKNLPCPVLTIDANLELEDMQPSYLLCEERLFQKAAVANC